MMLPKVLKLLTVKYKKSSRLLTVKFPNVVKKKIASVKRILTVVLRAVSVWRCLL